MAGIKRKQVHENMSRLLSEVVAATLVQGTLATAFANTQVVDGVTLVTGDRLLLRAQTDPIENGVYIVAVSGAPDRITLTDDLKVGSLASGARVRSAGGTVNAGLVFECTTDRATSIVGTSGLVFETATITTFVVPTQSDKGLNVGGDTAGDLAASGLLITSTPSSDGHVSVSVNGLGPYEVGDAVKTTDCYFSADGGTTARAIDDIIATDELIWNGVISGFNLETDDRVDFEYNV